MVEVRLHGDLARQFGMIWHLDIKSPREAVEAIDANRPGFRKRIMELAEMGMVFRVRSKNHDYCNDDVHTTLGRIDRVDIIPIVVGASAAVRFVIGAVLVAVDILSYGASGGTLTAIGVSMMLGAVVEWLTPTPKKEDFKSLKSWTVSGPTNTADQGQPVPIIYGEVLAGGYPISAGLSISRLDAAGSSAPSVSIGGQLELSYVVENLSPVAAVFQLGVGAFNIDEPFTYTWSYAGFTGATLSDEGLDTATLRLKVDAGALSGLAGSFTEYTGTATARIDGYQPGTRTSDGPVATYASVTVNLKVSFGVREDGGGD